MRMSSSFVAVIVAGLAAGAASAATYGSNLIVNGDAETGDLTGWSVSGGSPVATTSTAPTPPFEVYSFWGGGGVVSKTMSQSIDLSMLAADIDAGRVAFDFSGQLQWRRANILDSVVATLSFRDDGMTALGGGVALEDPTSASNVFTWDFVSATGLAPAGARSATVTLAFARTGGTTTDAYADDLDLTLSRLSAVPLPAALPMLGAALGGLVLAGRRRR